MTTPRVYADFNAILCAQKREGVPEIEMPITGFGTLTSLAFQGVRLEEGMPILLFEPNDIQCEAIAHFDHQLIDPAGRVGAWVAVFDPEMVQDSVLPELPNVHPCISCGTDIYAYLLSHGVTRYFEHCPTCGTSVMEPMAPPL